ncbi:hypothetical protein BKA62DRAFT_712907 [Auriculariales sp. MPI-PUGE-AT-0066]|nr:hypothetical protein BKA62DRAFT_712907 [Auriculariales sp. MPI-PUGE-AT-0066]
MLLIMIINDPSYSHASVFSTVLQTTRNIVDQLLQSLGSVLQLPDDLDTDTYKGRIRPFHKSFADFIEDSKRCTDSRFCTADHAAHTRLCLLYLKQMTENNFLKREEASELVQLAIHRASYQWFAEFSRGSWTDTVNQRAILEQLELFNPEVFSISWFGHCDYLYMMSFCHLFDLVSQRRPAIVQEFHDGLDNLTAVTLSISNDRYNYLVIMHAAMACALLTVANMPDGDSRGQMVTNFSRSAIGTSLFVNEWTLLRCCAELKVKYANDAKWTYEP